jgi:hypothetical protein
MPSSTDTSEPTRASDRGDGSSGTRRSTPKGATMTSTTMAAPVPLRRDLRTAPILAASIFLDVLNVFLLFLTIFSGDE